MLSLGILLRSLTALLLGGLVHLPVIGLSAVALGVLELGIDWHQGDTVPLLGIDLPPLDAVLAVVVLVALLLRRRGAGRTDIDDQSSWQAADEVRPIPGELTRTPEVRWGRIGIAVAIGALALALPHLLAVDQSLKASAVMVYAILAMSIVVLTGWAGQVSLGQVAFFAIGAAVGAKAHPHVERRPRPGGGRRRHRGCPRRRPGRPPRPALPGALPGGDHVRLRAGHHRVLPRTAATSSGSRTSASSGSPLLGRIDISSPTRIYYVVLAGLVLVLVGLRGIRHSRTGRVLIALRDNERGAQAYSVDVVRAKLTAFAVSGFVAAFAGALFVHHQQAFGSQPYQPSENLAVFAMAVVGGITSLPGALLGALYLLGTRWFLPLEWQFLASGFGVLLVLMLLPSGLGGLLFDVRDQALRWIANRRDILVPSLLADRAETSDANAGDEATPLPSEGDEVVAEPEPVPEPVQSASGRSGA